MESAQLVYLTRGIYGARGTSPPAVFSLPSQSSKIENKKKKKKELTPVYAVGHALCARFIEASENA